MTEFDTGFIDLNQKENPSEENQLNKIVLLSPLLSFEKLDHFTPESLAWFAPK